MDIERILRTRVAWFCTALLCCAPLCGASAAASAGDPTALVSVPANAPGLAELGLELEHVTRDGDRIVLAASAWDREQLERAGIDTRLLHPDLESFYAARLRSERWLWGGAAPESTPGFGFGSMGGYYTWDEVGQKLDEMRLRYPSIVTAKRSLGLSHEGREVWMAMISDHVDRADEHEPAVLFTGLTHAREPIGMETALYFMFHLLEGYGTDPEVTYLVNERQLYFVPVLNPDGYVYNQTTNPNGGGMWRKNRRDNGGGVFGVDLNRNYGYLWGFNNLGSSPSPGSGTYRGPAPFSEPETGALRTFHGYQRVVTAFHYHAYGNYEIHPFAYQSNAFPPQPDLDLYLRFAADIQALNGFQVGNFAQTLGYLANGEAIDWSYGEQVEKDKVFAFLPEVGNSSDGFWPPSSRILPLVELNLGANLYWAWIAGASGELVQVSAAPFAPAGATVPVVATVENRGLGATAGDLSVRLETTDPHATVAVASKPFPALAPQALANNSSNPLELIISSSAPSNHPIPLTLTLEQGGVVRARQPVWVTVQ